MQTDSVDSRPPQQGQLLVGRQSPELREALWRLVREVKADDPLAPVTVVGPTRYANLSLRQDLGHSSFANVRFIVLPMLTELLGGAALARAGRRPLSAVLESVWLRALMAKTTGLLAPVSGHQATHARVRSAFGELRRVDDAVLTSLAGQDGVPGEIARLYREFRHSTRFQWYDAEDLAAAAAEAAIRGEVAGLQDLGAIVFYLPRNVSPAETELIEALAQQRACSVLLGTTGDSAADRPVDTLTDALKPRLGAPQVVGRYDGLLPLLPGAARLHIAPTTHDELRWVIRRIVQAAAEQRIPFHRMAILYRMETPYASLISEELRMAGIPMAGPTRETLADSAVGRALVGLLGMSGGEFRREHVMEWLTGCPIRPPSDQSATFSPSRWDSLTKQAGIVRGLAQWRGRLSLFAERLAAEATRRVNAEEISEARAERMQAEAATAREVLAFVEGLAQDVEPPADGSRWAAFSGWAKRLLDRYLSHTIPEAEQAALDKVVRALEELGAADSISEGTTRDEFRQTVEDSLRATIGHLGVTGQGVFVSTIAAAGGMRFDRIWLVGMVEGGMPPAVRPDPLLPEPDWHAAGGQSRIGQRIAAERHDYLAAVVTAPQRELSYPLANAGSQREAYPSRWFLEQASALEGRAVHTSGLLKLRDRPWLTVADSGEQALTGTAETALADRHDYDLHRLLHWRRAGRRLRDHPFAQRGTLARATRLGRSRNLSWLTEFDGNLSAVSEEAAFGQQLRASAVSATGLESWATCPFRYFLGHVLRLSALDTPEETTSITPLERGSLIHEILERYLREVSAAGQLPQPQEAWSSQSRGSLLQIAEEEFGKAETRGVTGKRLLWELEKEDIRTDLETFLEEDAELRASHGTGQVLVEAGFGFGGQTLDVEDPETQVRFRGFIDRIDISADKRSALVLDYKTGSAGRYKGYEDDPIDQGKRLQLGIYSLAAQQLVPEATVIRAAYWFTTTRGGFKFFPQHYFDINDDKVRERFREGLTAIVAGIGGGLFPANPGPIDREKPANCTFCDFDSLCAARRIDLWERKQSDPLLAPYLALGDASGEDRR